MEDLPEEIINELKKKAIEKGSDTIITEDITEEKPKKKVKKPRSEAQKAAFEKARLKRAENLKIK